MCTASRTAPGGDNTRQHHTRGKFPGVIQWLISDRRCDVDVLMVCLPRVYRHRPPEIRGSSVIRKKLLLDRLAVAAHSKPRSCGMKNQRESSDSRSASRHARALIRAARQAPGGVSLSRRTQAARERNGARSWIR